MTKTYIIKAITPIICTARDSTQLLKDVDFKDADFKGNSKIAWSTDKRKEHEIEKDQIEKIRIIYPAYFNGIDYYIPGSTVKGNLLKVYKRILKEENKYTTVDIEGMVREFSNNVFVSDFILEKESLKHVKLAQLSKVQGLEKYLAHEDGIPPELKNDVFFNSIYFEIYDKDSKFKGKIRGYEKYKVKIEGKAKYSSNVKKIFNKTEKEIFDNENNEVLSKNLKKLEKKESKMMLIGGFRGFFNAFETKNKEKYTGKDKDTDTEISKNGIYSIFEKKDQKNKYNIGYVTIEEE
ncbi:MAG: hypothetical protein KA277_10035 [Fusobacteriaceae bacterium]|nr:hypothetical protein [Fusobacteriaceae bacterium]